jgi:hypothetical protein
MEHEIELVPHLPESGEDALIRLAFPSGLRQPLRATGQTPKPTNKSTRPSRQQQTSLSSARAQDAYPTTGHAFFFFFEHSTGGDSPPDHYYLMTFGPVPEFTWRRIGRIYKTSTIYMDWFISSCRKRHHASAT